MQLELQPPKTYTASGNTDYFIEPDFKISGLVVNVTDITITPPAGVTFKAQHSPNGTDWNDVPGLQTSAVSEVGQVVVSLNTHFVCSDYLRIAWTLTNTTSVTFSGFLLGTK